jgi:hypothetical protein
MLWEIEYVSRGERHDRQRSNALSIADAITEARAGLDTHQPVNDGTGPRLPDCYRIICGETDLEMVCGDRSGSDAEPGDES